MKLMPPTLAVALTAARTFAAAPNTSAPLS